MTKTQILNKLQEYYKCRSAAEFARKLGISPQNLGKWKERNTFDTDIILTKCPEIEPRWLVDGEGNMLRISASPDNAIQKTENNIEILVDIIKKQAETVETACTELYRMRTDNDAQINAQRESYDKYLMRSFAEHVKYQEHMESILKNQDKMTAFFSQTMPQVMQNLNAVQMRNEQLASTVQELASVVSKMAEQNQISTANTDKVVNVLLSEHRGGDFS